MNLKVSFLRNICKLSSRLQLRTIHNTQILSNNTQNNENVGETHFGFETVKESEKASKGNDITSINLIYIFFLRNSYFNNSSQGI